jgi:hypothetical protein
MTMEGVKPTPVSRRAWTRREPTARSGRGPGADPRVARAGEAGEGVVRAVEESRQSGSGTVTVDKQWKKREEV